MKIIGFIKIFCLIVLLSPILMLGQKAEIRDFEEGCVSKVEAEKRLQILWTTPDYSQILTENCQSIQRVNLFETGAFFRLAAS